MREKQQLCCAVDLLAPAMAFLKTENAFGSPYTDRALAMQLTSSLKAHRGLSHTDIRAHVDSGLATLSGVVSDERQKQLAVECAGCMSGIVAVRDGLSVRVADKELEPIL